MFQKMNFPIKRRINLDTQLSKRLDRIQEKAEEAGYHVSLSRIINAAIETALAGGDQAILAAALSSFAAPSN